MSNLVRIIGTSFLFLSIFLLFFSCDLYGTEEVETYSITYHANGADSGTVPVDDNEYKEGQEITVSVNTGNLKRERYIFAGWNTEHDGSGIQYGGGSSLVISTSAVELYALWYEIPSSFAGGSGTEEDPYKVETAGHLYIVRNHLDKHFIQIADIDLSVFSEGEGWEPIGAWYGVGYAENEMFVGSFDGNGYTIRNLTIIRGERNGIGLFGYVGDDTTLTHITLEDINVEGRQYVGGLIGLNESSGDISHCLVSGTVYGDDSYVGGLIGRNQSSNIYASHATTDVAGRLYIGGLIGSNGGNISESYAIGNVNGRIYYTGGLIGYNHGAITSSYATGDVTGYSPTGGLIGFNSGDVSDSYATGDVTGRHYTGGLIGHSSSNVSDSYATGNVEGTEQVGGLIGRFSVPNPYTRSVIRSFSTGAVSGTVGLGGLIGVMPNGTVEDSYYDTETSGRSDDIGRGSPKTTEEMMQQSTFENWDFDTIWAIDEDDSYPYLRWEID